MYLKLFGERNTGTNVLSSLIQINSESFQFPGTLAELNPEIYKKVSLLIKNRINPIIIESEIDKGFKKKPITHQWKHSATNFNENSIVQDTHYIFIVRDPLSWFISLFKNPYNILFVNRPRTLTQFLNTDIQTLGRDNLNIKYVKPLDLYFKKLNSYLTLINILKKNSLGFSIIKFEDIVINQKEVTQTLHPYLKKPNYHFKPLNESTKDRSKNLQYYQGYYGSKIWLKEIPPNLNYEKYIDKDLLLYFGY